MSPLSGAFTVEIPTDRLARNVAAEVVELLDRYDLIGKLADAVARALSEPGEPGGYPITGDRSGGEQHYDRGEQP